MPAGVFGGSEVVKEMKVQEGERGVSFRRPSFTWKHLAVEDIFKGRRS